MIYIYAPDNPAKIADLIKALDGKRLLRYDGYHFVDKGRPVSFDPGDAIVCWGHHVPPVPNVTMINSNYKFVSQLEFNKQVNRMQIDEPNCVFAAITPMHPSEYRSERERAEASNWTITEMPPSGLRVSPVFENYGTVFYRHTREGIMIVAGKQVVYSSLPAGTMKESQRDKIVQFIASTGFDLLALRIGAVGESFLLHHLLTGPPLTEKLVAVYRDAIRELLANRPMPLSFEG